MTDYSNNTNLPRGFRNNNPGNLQKTAIAWQGKIPLEKNTDSRFEQFESMEYGVRALVMDLYNDITKKGLNTPVELMNEYAPPFENNTSSYTNKVANSIGIRPTDPINIDGDKMRKIVDTIIQVENGQKLPMSIIEAGFDKLPTTTKISLSKTVKRTSQGLLVGLLVGFGLLWYQSTKSK